MTFHFIITCERGVSPYLHDDVRRWWWSKMGWKESKLLNTQIEQKKKNLIQFTIFSFNALCTSKVNYVSSRLSSNSCSFASRLPVVSFCSKTFFSSSSLRHEAAAAADLVNRRHAIIVQRNEEGGRFSRKIHKTYSFRPKIAESSKIIEFVIFKLS